MKRNLSSEKEEVVQPPLKVKKIITKKNIKSVTKKKTLSNTSKNIKPKKASNERVVPEKSGTKFGITINITKDICLKEDESLFKRFEDAKDIILGRKFFIEYSTKIEAIKKLKELSGSSFAGHNITAKLDTCPAKLKNNIVSAKSGPINRTSPSLHLVDVPVSINISTIKKHFPKAVFISKRKKKTDGKFKKCFVLRYLQQAQAENDLNLTKTIKIDGQNILAKLILPSENGQGKLNNIKNKKESTGNKNSKRNAPNEGNGVGGQIKKRKKINPKKTEGKLN